jgi:hypothetical protein
VIDKKKNRPNFVLQSNGQENKAMKNGRTLQKVCRRSKKLLKPD